MLPADETDQIVLVISEAFSTAAEGRIPRGYLLLTDGIRAARSLRTPWADEAVKLWDLALERFKERFPTEWYPEGSD